MEYILIALIIALIVQVILTLIKKKKIEHNKHLSKANELMGYINNKATQLTDEKGRNALMIACDNHFYKKNGEYDYFDVVKAAVDCGFDLNIRSHKDGKTALMYAVRHPLNYQSAEYLVQNQANVNITDTSNRTLLFDAVKRGKERYYQLVVNGIENINHQDNSGVTPLMVACYDMNFDVINDLLARGANVKLTNNAGENAYDVASKHMSRHIKRVVASQNEDGMGKPQNITTEKDVLEAQKHNHEVREMVRKLNCMVNDTSYEYKRFKRPFFNTGKAN